MSAGRGQVAWINAEGMAGVVPQAFHEKEKEHLEAWLMSGGITNLSFRKNTPEGVSRNEPENGNDFSGRQREESYDP